MNRRLQRYFGEILAIWLVLFAVLVLVSLQGMDWAPRPPAAEEPLPVAAPPAPAPVPSPAPAPTPAPSATLLERGRTPGNGTLGEPRVVRLDETSPSGGKRVAVILPYTGTLGRYTSFLFNNNGSQCFDLHGTWRTSPVSHLAVADKTLPVHLMQTGQHGSFVRLSLSGDVNHPWEVRYTPTELHFVMDTDGPAQAQAPAPKAAKPAQGAASQAKAAPAKRSAQAKAQAAPAKNAQGAAVAAGKAPAGQAQAGQSGAAQTQPKTPARTAGGSEKAKGASQGSPASR